VTIIWSEFFHFGILRFCGCEFSQVDLGHIPCVAAFMKESGPLVAILDTVFAIVLTALPAVFSAVLTADRFELVFEFEFVLLLQAIRPPIARIARATQVKYLRHDVPPKKFIRRRYTNFKVSETWAPICWVAYIMGREGPSFVSSRFCSNIRSRRRVKWPQISIIL